MEATMKGRLFPMLVAAAAVATAFSARADAGATVTLFGGPNLTLNHSGFVFDGGPRTVVLNPGQSLDFSIDYTLSVHDSGLPAPFDPAFAGCLPLHDTVCNPAYAGFEVAKAMFDVAYRDGRVANPFITLTSDTGTRVSLETHADSFAEVLSRSGTIHYTLTNGTSFVQTDNFFVTFAAGWVLAVPEPATWAQLAAGLALLAAALRSRAWPSRAARTPA
jgi:hypothetical protein